MSNPTHARLDSRNGGRAVFDGMRVEGRLQGLLLDLSARQTFRNPGTAHVELVYTFPLPADAVLLSMTVRLGERRLAATVVEKRVASARYEDSLADGDSAVMLEKTRDGSYCLSIGNLAPGETGEITLRYAQALAFAGNALRVCVPTVIAPRYGDPLRDAGLAPYQVTAHDLGVHYPFALTLELASAFAGATIGSPSHRIGVRTGSGGISVTLAADAALDRDFILTVGDLPQASAAIAAPDPVTPGQAAVLAGFQPRMAETGSPLLRAKILVDCSGSMAGDSIDAARKALQAVIDQLREGERFSLSRFGDTVEHRTHLLWKATEVTRLSARRWAGDLQADLGGTDMEAALASTFALDPAQGGDVLLVTDGQIHAIDAVLKAACTAKSRVFIVAIGSSPAEGHLRRLARATGGAIDFVAPGEGVGPAIGRMFARLRSPRLDALRLAWATGRAAAWTTLPDAVFAGDTAHVYALVDGDTAGDTLRLYGRDAAGTEHEIGSATVMAAPDDGALARMAVHARLHGRKAPAIDERTGLACAYSLVTEHTNFLLTVERAPGEKAQDMPELQRVAQMLPAGWGGAGSVVLRSGALPSMPAVWRREAASDGIRVAQRQAPYNLPVMFRRAVDDDLRPSMPDDVPKRSRLQRIAAFWRSDAGPAHLSPLALHRMLVSTPCELWDRSYDDLRAANLDPALVDWLRSTFGASHPEEEVVASFLCCMAQPAMRRALAGRTLAGWIGLSRRYLRTPPHADAALAARMAQDLAGITADNWPLLLLVPGPQAGALPSSVSEKVMGSST